MERSRVNVAVGMFLVLGILALGYLSIKLGRVSFLGGGGYAVIVDLHRRFRFTAVMVSHEIPEIFGIADTVAMLHEGRIEEAGPPEVIQASANLVVQRFIRGEPEHGEPLRRGKE